MIVIVMGVCGCGKTTVGRLVAESIGAIFVEGDRFHPAANIAKMSAGIPLTDADRWPWLDSIATALLAWDQRGENAVLACSALKKSYRDRLFAAVPAAHLVYLRADRDLVEQRMAARQHHFMPTTLIPSQFAALEEPRADDRPQTGWLTIADISAAPEMVAAHVVAGITRGLRGDP